MADLPITIQKPFARMRIPKGSELLARQIREAIFAGDLLEGEMLPSEKDLVAQLGLSRATVREGLRLLEAEGLISTRVGRGGGATVQRPSPDGHTRSLAALLQFDGSSLEQLFEAWSVLVPVCGRLAATHITHDQIVALDQHLAKMEGQLDNCSAFTALEVRFHTLIAQGTNNAVLRIYSASLAELTYHQIQHMQFSREEMELGLAACRAILQSVEQGDGARAEQRIAKHLAAVEKGIMRPAQPIEDRPTALMNSGSSLAEMAGKHPW
jgi:GntR family transcriptional regulator, transcriptional repressor for pyruvate dehydrogenase complex